MLHSGKFVVFPFIYEQDWRSLIIHKNNIKGSLYLPVERKCTKREYHSIYIAAMHFICSGGLPLKFGTCAYE